MNKQEKSTETVVFEGKTYGKGHKASLVLAMLQSADKRTKEGTLRMRSPSTSKGRRFFLSEKKK